MGNWRACLEIFDEEASSLARSQRDRVTLRQSHVPLSACPSSVRGNGGFALPDGADTRPDPSCKTLPGLPNNSSGIVDPLLSISRGVSHWALRIH